MKQDRNSRNTGDHQPPSLFTSNLSLKNQHINITTNLAGSRLQTPHVLPGGKLKAEDDKDFVGLQITPCII